jgi:4-hydroxy-tetrahydrodipicolinate synthase
MSLTYGSLRGIVVATTTPFSSDGGICKKSLQSHVEYLIGQGAAGLAPLGGTGEYPALSSQERTQVIEWTCEAARSRVPVIAGVLATGYNDAIYAGQQAKKAGADAIMLVTPFYTIGEDEGVYEYFANFQKAIGIPIILYEIPRRTNVELSAEIIAKMANDGVIVGMKYCGLKIDKLIRLAQLAGDKLAIFSGEESLFLAHLAIGAKGGVLALANLDPSVWINMQSLVEQGLMAEAIELHAKYSDLISAVYSEMNPIGLKVAMQAIGLERTGSVRLPLTPAKNTTVTNVMKALTDTGMAKTISTTTEH